MVDLIWSRTEPIEKRLAAFCNYASVTPSDSPQPVLCVYVYVYVCVSLSLSHSLPRTKSLVCPHYSTSGGKQGAKASRHILLSLRFVFVTVEQSPRTRAPASLRREHGDRAGKDRERALYCYVLCVTGGDVLFFFSFGPLAPDARLAQRGNPTRGRQIPHGCKSSCGEWLLCLFAKEGKRGLVLGAGVRERENMVNWIACGEQFVYFLGDQE